MDGSDGSWGGGNGSWGSSISGGGNGSWGSGVSGGNGGWGSSGISDLSDGWGSNLGNSGWGSSGISNLSDGWGSNSGDWGSVGNGNWLVNLVGVSVSVNVVGSDNILNWVDFVWFWVWNSTWNSNWDWDTDALFNDDFSFDWDWDSTWDWNFIFVYLELWNNVGGSWGKGDVGSAWGKDLFLDNGISWSWAIVVELLWESWGSWGWDSWSWEGISLGSSFSWFSNIADWGSWDDLGIMMSVLVSNLDSLGSYDNLSGSNNTVLDFSVGNWLTIVKLFSDMSLWGNVFSYNGVSDVSFTNLSVSDNSGMWGNIGWGS